jgi:hypothetical protein
LININICEPAGTTNINKAKIICRIQPQMMTLQFTTLLLAESSQANDIKIIIPAKLTMLYMQSPPFFLKYLDSESRRFVFPEL